MRIVNKLKNSRYRLQLRYTKYLKNSPIDEKIILYQSFQGKSMTGNPYAIFKNLISQDEFSKYTHVWAMDSDMIIQPFYEKHPNVIFVEIDSMEYIKYLATAKYLINNTSFPYYFQKNQGQVYINTWHGTPLKTLGTDIKDTKVSAHSNIQRNLLQVDYLVSQNKFTYEKLLNSHDCQSIYNGKILDIGYPRIDLTINHNNNNIKSILSIEEGKKVILYAPTWRGKVGTETDTSKILLNDLEHIKSKVTDEYIVLLKAHYFTYNYFKENGCEHLCVPEYVDSNELLSVVDILITDYSSIFFDFLATENPVIFYSDDYEDYEKTRGFYIPYETMPGPICRNIDDLIETIVNIDDIKVKYNNNYSDFLKTYCYNDDGLSTERLINIVFNNASSNKMIQLDKTDKIKILIHCGSFANNGITISAINLLNELDYEQYDVTLTTSGRNHQCKKVNLDKLNPNVKTIHRIGSLNKTLWEGFKHYLIRQLHIKSKAFFPSKLYEREIRRIIGNSEFDIGIDFGGYNILWSLLIAFGPFKKKIIYQHNDMIMEYNKVINGKLRHRKNLSVIFSLYSLYDTVVSVSKSAMESNKKNLQEYYGKSDVKYVNNLINYKRILSLKDKGDYLQYHNKNYLVLEKHDNNDILTALKVNTELTNFINIGRFSPEKGQEKLIIAFSQLKEVYKNIKLYIVGEGILEEELKKLVNTLEISDDIIFTGQINNVFPLINLCDCFVLSSNYEGQGLVLLESLVLDKPTISTDVTGAHSVLENGYGLLVDNSIEGIKEGMKKYLEEGTISSKKFDYKEYNKQALEMFYSLLK